MFVKGKRVGYFKCMYDEFQLRFITKENRNVFVKKKVPLETRRTNEIV